WSRPWPLMPWRSIRSVDTARARASRGLSTRTCSRILRDAVSAATGRMQVEEHRNLIELATNGLTIPRTQTQQLLLRRRERFQLRVAIRVVHSLGRERHLLIQCRRLQQHADRTLEHAIEVALWIPELAVGL